ncbi:MAG TPA: hypothetical protein VIY08_12500 [Candidatus Nitrosocosmicus sp.]
MEDIITSLLAFFLFILFLLIMNFPDNKVSNIKQNNIKSISGVNEAIEILAKRSDSMVSRERDDFYELLKKMTYKSEIDGAIDKITKYYDCIQLNERKDFYKLLESINRGDIKNENINEHQSLYKFLNNEDQSRYLNL